MKKILSFMIIVVLLMGCSVATSELSEPTDKSNSAIEEINEKPVLVSVMLKNVDAYEIIDSGFKAAAYDNNAQYESVVFNSEDIKYESVPKLPKVQKFLDSVNNEKTAAFCYDFQGLGFQEYFQAGNICCAEVLYDNEIDYSYVDVLVELPSLSEIYSVAGDYIVNNFTEDDTCGFAYMTGVAVEEESPEFLAINEMTKQMTGKVGFVGSLNVENGESTETYTPKILDYIEQNSISVLFCSRLISPAALYEIKQTYPDIKIIYANTLTEGANSVAEGIVEMAVDMPLYSIGYGVATELINCVNGADFKNTINPEPYSISSKEEAKEYLNKIMQDYPPAK